MIDCKERPDCGCEPGECSAKLFELMDSHIRKLAELGYLRKEKRDGTEGYAITDKGILAGLTLHSIFDAAKMQ
jgi:hypothetical protein